MTRVPSSPSSQARDAGRRGSRREIVVPMEDAVENEVAGGGPGSVDATVVRLPIPRRVRPHGRNLTEKRRDGDGEGDTADGGSPSLLSGRAADLSPRDAHNRRRKGADRRTRDGVSSSAYAGVIVPLYRGYGVHYVNLWVGSPVPQRRTLIVDTASDVTAFPCEECRGCGREKGEGSSLPPREVYRQSSSETFGRLGCDECVRGDCVTGEDATKKMVEGGRGCRVGRSYNEGSSWNAYEARDVCHVGGAHIAPSDPSLEGGLRGDDGDRDSDGGDISADPREAPRFRFELAFACQVSIAGKFVYQLADGIMGMEDSEASFWRQMHAGGAMARMEFSLCIGRPPLPPLPHEAENGIATAGIGRGVDPLLNGALTFGGSDRRLRKGGRSMTYAKMINVGKGFYTVHIRAVYLCEGGGVAARKSLEDIQPLRKLEIDESRLNEGGFILDSGTTDTHFPLALTRPFRKAWEELTGTDRIHARLSLTEEELEKMPTLLLVLTGWDGYGEKGSGDRPGNDSGAIVTGPVGDQGLLSDNPRDVVLAVPARHYMEYDLTSRMYIPRLVFEDTGDGSILGANVMMGHDIHFDVARGRVGFAESDCNYASLLKSEALDHGEVPSMVTGDRKATSAKGGKVHKGGSLGAGGPGVAKNQAVRRQSGGAKIHRFRPDPQRRIPSSSSGRPQDMHGQEGGTSFHGASKIYDELRNDGVDAVGMMCVAILAVVAMAMASVRSRTVARRRVVRHFQGARLGAVPDLVVPDVDDKCLRKRKAVLPR